MRILGMFAVLSTVGTCGATAQTIRATPATANVNSQGATTTLLAYTGLGAFVPAEASWCARLIIGPRCDPATVYAQTGTPSVSGPLSGGVFTDVVSTPPSIARQAYQAAATGQSQGQFYYVRRFTRFGADSDRFVAVTLRLTGGGASTPFVLTNVALKADPETPVLFVRSGEVPPPLHAELQYNGSGWLRGRWEVVYPGDQLPTSRDLVTEASLPPAERGLQRRYHEIERFDVLLAPTGRYTLRGPDPRRLPTLANGSYLVLLRVEVADDRLSDVITTSAAGSVHVDHNGASAGFPMPTIRYVVGSSGDGLPATQSSRQVALVSPRNGAVFPADSALTLQWSEDPGADRYRVEVERIANGVIEFSAIVRSGTTAYQVPPFIQASVRDSGLRWRVIALDGLSRELRRSEWRSLLLKRNE